MSEQSDREKIAKIRAAVRSFPDFPVAGVVFRDLFGVLSDPPVFALLKEQLVKLTRQIRPAVECVVGLDARGFLFGPIIALELRVPFVPVRKKGKLPGKVQSLKYALEYGEDSVEIQDGAIRNGEKVLIVDDLLATGGTLNAANELVKKIGGQVVKCLVVIELTDLKGREKVLADIISLLQF